MDCSAAASASSVRCETDDDGMVAFATFVFQGFYLFGSSNALVFHSFSWRVECHLLTFVVGGPKLGSMGGPSSGPSRAHWGRSRSRSSSSSLTLREERDSEQLLAWSARPTHAPLRCVAQGIARRSIATGFGVARGAATCLGDCLILAIRYWNVVA